MRKVYYCSPGGILPKAPREPGTEVCKGVKIPAQDRQQRVLGPLTESSCRPLRHRACSPPDWLRRLPQQMEGRGALPICAEGYRSLGMGSETPAEPGSQTQPSQAPGEAPAGGLHPPHLGSLDQRPCTADSTSVLTPL